MEVIFTILKDYSSEIQSLGVILIVIQIIVIIIQNRKDHERSRRENTVTFLKQWANELTQKSAQSRRFVEELNTKQIKSLFEEREFEVDLDLKSYLKLIFKSIKKTKSNKIKLTAKQSSELRWEIMHYLNNLECILLLWLYNIGTKQILERQFNYLYSSQKGHFLLKEFRQKAGGADAFPAIEAFSLYMAKKEEKIIKGKSKL